MEIITLSNGKKVGNFSSPHPFTFEDGSVLPAVSNEEAERLKVTFIETPVDKMMFRVHTGLDGDVELKFELNDAVKKRMWEWSQMSDKKLVDVVYCPLPKAIKDENGYSMYYLLTSPFRAIRIEDRIKKLVSIHKQCI